MGKICWDFPLLGTGSLSGSNDAAIAMFKGGDDMDGLAREICQNSLDARAANIDKNTPVKVQFKLFEVEREKHPMFADFQQALSGAINHWQDHPLKNDAITKFLANVQSTLEQPRIPVLLISDYNTIGLNGAAPQDNAKNRKVSYWDLLVNTEGISIKPDDRNSAGSYGIGKNAPFAYSGLSMVFYNTLAQDGGRAFEGVTHLVTTQKEFKGEMQPTQPSGKYLFLENTYKGRPILPTDNCSLAKLPEFQRQEVGTDVAVMGFKKDLYSDWERSIAIAVVKNFILALQRGQLEVEVTSDRKHYLINKDQLEQLLYTEFQQEPNLKHTRQIYETITMGDRHDRKVVEDGDLSIYVRYDENYQASLSRFRSTGMLINSHKGPLPHYAVVIVANETTESTLCNTLRAAEPPQHTEWKSSNIANDTKLRNKAKSYIGRITTFMKEVLRSLDHIDESASIDAGVGNYLANPDAPENESSNDGLQLNTQITDIVDATGTKLYHNQFESGKFSEGAPAGRNATKSGKPMKRRRKKKPISVVNPNKTSKNKKPKKGAAQGSGTLRITTLSLSEHRMFYTGNEYRLFVKAPQTYRNVYVECFANREDDKTDTLTIKSIKTSDGTWQSIDSPKAGPLVLNEGGNSLAIKFTDDEVMAISPRFTIEVKSNEHQ